MFRPAPAIFAALLALATPALAQGGRTAAPENATVEILAPEDGAVLSNPVTLVFGLSGMGVAPAGVEHENTGHHHLLVDVSPAAINMAEPLPSDEQHIHFGDGQTQAELELPEGTHTLRVLLADHNHVPHDPPIMSNPVSITIE